MLKSKGSGMVSHDGAGGQRRDNPAASSNKAPASLIQGPQALNELGVPVKARYYLYFLGNIFRLLLDLSWILCARCRFSDA